MRLAAHISLIDLDKGIRAAERTALITSRGHGFTDAVTEKPRGFVSHSEHALHLLGAHALLRRRHEVRCEQPFVERHMATLHDGAGADGELVAAVAAEPVTGLGLAAHLHGVRAATMGAERLAVRPAGAEDMLFGLGFIMEDRIGDADVHGGFLLPSTVV